MAIQVASFVVPKGGNKWYVLEDKFIKGGLQVVATTLERDAIEVDNRKAGMLVVVQADGKLYQLETSLTSWREFAVGGGGGSPVRQTVQYATDILAAAASKFFSLAMGRSALIFKLSVDTPCIVEAFSDSLRTETNPFRFVATSDHLVDDGSTLMSDGTVLRGRRYTILANLEEGNSGDIYFKITNNDATAKNINLSVQFLPIESTSL
jgi:hypothetical protein